MSTKRKGLKPEELTRLREAMQSGKIESLEEIRAWIEKDCGVSYTTRGVAKLLERELKAKRIWSFGPDSEMKIPEVTIVPDVNALIRFLNQIRITGDPSEDCASLKDGLLSLLENVDRVSVYTNIADIGPNEWYQVIVVDQGITLHQAKPMKPSEVGQPKSWGATILQHLRSQNAPLHLYHDPTIFEYHTKDGFHLGAIFLWQESNRRHRPLGNALSFMDHITPFIELLFHLIISQHSRSNFTNTIFHEALNNPDWRSTLSHQELRVITFRLLGFSYDEIADKLAIAKSTVHKHIISIHKKTGTSSIAELFGKYFTPRFNLRDDQASKERDSE